MKLIENVSRRGFLQGALATGVFVLGAKVVSEHFWVDNAHAAGVFQPDLFLSIAGDGTVTVVAHRSEMGCGSRTALPLVVADELDADWSKVKIEQAIGDPKYGDQDTDGSHSVRSFFDQMRQVGATGRVMLITAAAAQWNVSAKDCSTEPHFVVHKRQRPQTGLWRTGGRCGQTARSEEGRCSRSKRVRSGATSGKTAMPCSICPTWSPAKPSSAWTRRCREWCTRRSNIRRFSDRRSSRMTTKLRSKVPGVKKTVTIDTFKPPHAFQPLGGVAVIADNTWAAFQGRKSAEDRLGQQSAFGVQLGRVSQNAGSDLAAAGQSRAQRRRRGCRIRQGRQDHRSRVLHAASGARVHGTAGGRGRVSRRQSAGVGADAESAGRAGHACQRSRHQEGRRHLSCARCWAAGSDASRSPTRWPRRPSCRRNSASP